MPHHPRSTHHLHEVHHSHDWDAPQVAPQVLWRLIHANFPVTRFEGIYNHRNIAGTHKRSLHAEGRALDIGLSVDQGGEKVIGDRLFEIFIDVAGSIGFEEIIWNRKIWTAHNPYVHPYHGTDPHTGHIHVGFTRAASLKPVVPQPLVMKVGILRTGLEDLRKDNVA